MKEVINSTNNQVEKSELTSQNANDLKPETPKELEFDELLKRLEVYKRDTKKYSIPACKEEPPCEIIERMVKYGHNDVTYWDNHVTIVDPTFQYVEKITKHFYRHLQEYISFTFYLGSYHYDVLRYWHPEKPHFSEILPAIKLANAYGFEVKVKCFPYDLDTYGLVKTLTPFVDEIYIDIICDIQDLIVTADFQNFDKVIKANELIDSQTDDWVMSLVEKLNNIPIITGGGYIDRIRRSNMLLG